MNTISVLERNKSYVIVKIPRQLMKKAHLGVLTFSEDDALKILSEGMTEYKQRKTRRLASLRGLRS